MNKGKPLTVKISGKNLELLREAVEEMKLSGWQSSKFAIKKHDGVEIYSYILKKVVK